MKKISNEAMNKLAMQAKKSNKSRNKFINEIYGFAYYVCSKFSVNGYTAEDLAQSAMIEIMENLDQYSDTRGNAYTYYYLLIHRHCCSVYRSESVTHLSSTLSRSSSLHDSPDSDYEAQLIDLIESDTAPASDITEQAELYSRLIRWYQQAAVQLLSPLEMTCLCCLLRGMTYIQIAKIIENKFPKYKTASNVKTIDNARSRIKRKILAAAESDPDFPSDCLPLPF